MAQPANIRINAQFPFPSLVIGNAPVTIGKVSGVWSVSLNIDGLGATVPMFTQLATDYLLLWDSVAKTFSKVSLTTIGGRVVYGAPNTQVGATYIVLDADISIIANNAGATLTLTLPAPVNYVGRVLNLKTTQNQTVVSASANVVPLVGGAAGTAILAATAGKWAQLQSDGTNWIIMQGN